MTVKLEENETNQSRFTNKRGILVREDLEYSAQKLFTYATIGLVAIGIYASVAYLVVQQLRK